MNNIKKIISFTAAAALLGVNAICSPVSEISAQNVNIVSNSTFDSGTSGWGTYKESGGKASLTTENGQLALKVQSVGTLNYSVQVYYDIVPLYQNGVYRLKYDISSSIDRDVECMIQQNGGNQAAGNRSHIDGNQQRQAVVRRHVIGERQHQRNGQRAGQPDRSIDHAVDKPRDRVRERGEECRAQRRLFQPPIDLVELFKARLFVRECLHDLLIADHLVHMRRLLAARLRLKLEHTVRLSGNELCREQRKRRQHHNHQRNLPVDADHKRKCAKNRNHAGEQLRKAHQKAVGKLIHVGNHAADQLTARMRIQK